MGAKISNHNGKLLREKPAECGCNCQQPEECPMPGKCTTDKVVYRASVTANNIVETYVGLTAGTFKKRYGGHKHDFLNRPTENRISTTLSSHIWKLKDENKAYQVKFEIVKRAAPFSPVSGTCNLCTEEKFEIMFNPQTASLNSRQEMFAACRHKWAALIIKKKRKTKIFVGS